MLTLLRPWKDGRYLKPLTGSTLKGIILVFGRGLVVEFVITGLGKIGERCLLHANRSTA
jgi:hypothetical protein